jgi:uncharacterized protein YdeI (YjbR/CyaY-like superfamily)
MPTGGWGEKRSGGGPNRTQPLGTISGSFERRTVMGGRDPRVDAYIEKSAEFARPILSHLREVVHAACPQAEETIKWGFPHFTYQGTLCSMASFKSHCAFGFWKGEAVVGTGAAAEKAMGQFGRITSLADLPPRKTLAAYVKKAKALNEAEGPGRPGPKRKERGEVEIPDDLRAALRTDRKARATFEAFPPSHRREYVEWITEAMRPETRAKRLATTLEWLAEGKGRNWKYERG